MDRKYSSPQVETTRVLLEFLEVAINAVVFLKGIYPPGAFQRKRYMNIVVHKARHPQLATYIHSAVFSLQPFILKGLIERVVVIFYGEDQAPVERFVFKISVNQTHGSKFEASDLEFALRAFLIKLTVAAPLTKPLPSGCGWEITAYFRALPEGTSSDPTLWIPTDTKQWQMPPEITPIKSMNSDPLKVQLYLEHPCPSEPKVSTDEQ